jgi:lipoate-protein ligase A
VPASYRKLNDIVSPRGKIAGAAQARRRGTVLHHTTMAHAMDAGLVSRLIRVGRESVSTIGIRSAEKDVSPLAWFTSAPLEKVERQLVATFRAENGGVAGEPDEDELREAGDLVERKYATREWTYRLA